MRIVSDERELVRLALDYPDYCKKMDTKDWVDNSLNIAIQESDNFSLFEHEKHGVYRGHYFFKSAKGREAITLSKDMLNYFFNNSPATTVIGLVPVFNKKARWVSRQVGLSSIGLIETSDCVCELFYITKGAN